MAMIQQTQSDTWAIRFITLSSLLLSAGVLALLLLLSSPLGVADAIQGTVLTDEKLAWYLTRASGAVGYLLLTASTIWGLLLSTKIIKEIIPAPITLAMHNYLSWTAIGLSIFHAFVLLFDGYYTYTIANLLIPFTGPYKPGWVGIGIIGLYFMLLTSVSFYCRRWISQAMWRRLHYLTFGAYLLVTLHGWSAGTDSALLAPVYQSSVAVVLFLTTYRILISIASATEKRAIRKAQGG